MSATAVALADHLPPPAVAIEPTKGLFHLNLRDVWDHRELLYFLVWRDVKVRYKQTAIGVVWVILQPLLTMAIFTVIFGYFARFSTNGVPYALFAYTGLVPWLYFSSAISRSGASLVSEADVIRKVYFPRLIIPISALLGTLVDLAVGLLIGVAMIYWFGLRLTWTIWTLPLFLLLTTVAGLAIGLWLAALNVKYRDVGHAIPFLTQCWMYASPVIYPVSFVPQKYRSLYDLNPVVGMLEGFRWALLPNQRLEIGAIAWGAAVVAVLLGGGLVVFRYVERTLVDVI